MALLMPKFAMFILPRFPLSWRNYELSNDILTGAIEGHSPGGRDEWGRMGSLANSRAPFQQQDIRRTVPEATNTVLERLSCTLRP